MNLKLNKSLLLTFALLVLLVFVLVGCPTEATKSVVSTWNGTFASTTSPGLVGTVTDWIFYSDNTFTGTWTLTGSEVPELGATTGTYTLAEGALTGSGSGTATSGDNSSKFDLTFTGTLSDTTGTGNYTIDFAEPTWADDAGTWSITKE